MRGSGRATRLLTKYVSDLIYSSSAAITNAEAPMYVLYHFPYSQHARRVVSLLEAA